MHVELRWLRYYSIRQVPIVCIFYQNAILLSCFYCSVVICMFVCFNDRDQVLSVIKESFCAPPKGGSVSLWVRFQNTHFLII